jgi:type I restriction enzyme S subunit
MADEWDEVPLGEVITLQRGFDLPSQNRKPGKVPIVSSSGISDYHSEAAVNGPGVVTGRYGTIGEVFLIRDNYWPLNTTLWVKDFHGNDPYFVSYLLRTVDFQSCSDKSSVPGVNRNDLHRISVLRPPLATQRAIASVLGALDDKIELNRRMNATLEGMARALFQSWFVDFDPVRAKLDGRLPEGMDEETAALFPDGFEESELGPIPKGWRLCTLGEVAKNVSITFDFNRTPDVVFINTGDVLEGDFLHQNRSVHVGLPGQAKKSIRPDDILFSEIRPANKRYAYVDFDSHDYVVSTKFMIIRGSEEIHPRLLYRILTAKETLDKFQLQAESRSGTFPQITFDSISHLPLVLAPFEIQEHFQCIVGRLDAQIKVHKQTSRTLATLRDTLIPKLLSGELIVATTIDPEGETDR